MPKYRLDCTWMMSTSMVVEAPSLEEAIEAEMSEATFPTNGEYVQGSMGVTENVDEAPPTTGAE